MNPTYEMKNFIDHHGLDDTLQAVFDYIEGEEKQDSLSVLNFLADLQDLMSVDE